MKGAIGEATETTVAMKINMEFTGAGEWTGCIYDVLPQVVAKIRTYFGTC